MKKLLTFLDEKFLKFGIGFAIVFTALYPKLPSVHIVHTWVYIRLEDFLIALLIGFWIIQLVRKKVTLPFPVAKPIILYWIAGLASLVWCFVFIAPHLANFFPNVAILNYLRRIEYMLLFFVAFSTIKTEKDVVDYIKILLVTVLGIVLYGFGQRWYINLWSAFPHFFEKYSFCFPSFQTGNEEFAKGLPLCLPPDARITSTFGGHYDLAGYLVLLIPVLFASIFAFKNKLGKFIIFLLTISAIILLILTASRISFIAYFVGIVVFLIFIKQKKIILPAFIVSLALLLLFSASTAKRFLDTIRLTSVVTDTTGQVVGVSADNLPDELRKKISKNPVIVEAPPPSQNLPTGSSFITLPGKAVNTTTAVVKTKVPTSKEKELNLAYGGVEISTIKGTFLIKQALVYDISFTTRFQGEWPNAWNAFMRNPILGSGFSSISLATDGDYFRWLGETGLFGTLSFILIFIYFGILLKAASSKIPTNFGKYIAYGLAGGVLGLFFNATFIDIFEASKVAEPLWIFLGIGVGIVLLHYKDTTNYVHYLKKIFTSNLLIGIYLFIILGITFFPTISNFFVADDFTWMKWAAFSRVGDVIGYFTNAGGFFYRPLDKLLIFFLYTFSAFRPEGYHLFMLFLHFFAGLAVYAILQRLFNKKIFSFTGALLFILSASHGENVYWISTISTSLSTVFILYGVLSWIKFRDNNSKISYIVSIIWGILSLLSYEMAIIFPVLLLITDIILLKVRKIKDLVLPYIVFGLLLVLYYIVRIVTHSAVPGGDYAYNISHLPQNIVGNFLGYMGLFIKGEYFLPLYTHLRDILRMYPQQVGISIAIILSVLLSVIVIARKKIDHIPNKEVWSVVLYGIVFAFVSLLPFLGLGNLAERYIYLASVGYVIATMAIIRLFYRWIKTVFGRSVAYPLLIGVSVLLLVGNAVAIRQASTQWYEAGEITRLALAQIRVKHESIPPYSRFYMVNVPIRHKNAWVFPTGVNDGVWFIYREESPRIYPVSSVIQAKDLIHNSDELTKAFIFVFDDKGHMKEL